MKYTKKLIETFDNPAFPVFTINDVKTLFNGTNISERYVHLMMHNLMKSRKIVQITRGVYTFHAKEVMVTGFAFTPFYYGLENALRIHGISMQATNPLVITSRNVRAGVKQFLGRNYVIYRLKSKYMFGYGMKRYINMWIPVSDIEKTVIDMIYLKIAIRDELWPGILKALNMPKLLEYLQSYYNPGFRSKAINIINSAKANTNVNKKTLTIHN